MHRSFKVILFFSVIALVAVLLLRPNPSAAGDIILTHNRGGENAVFFVNDEPSLVINGFDLSPHTTRFPIALDAVSISVDRPAPGSRIDMVIYQDANGGSPVDASLVHRQSVQINRRGVQRFILNEAAIITEPVVWVGFYLPVGFRFHADTSGPSVLTYWAWAPGGTFPLDNLASAPVLGPGDGTEPVSIDMQGVARITAELRPLFHQEMASDAVLGNQLIAEGEQDTSLLQGYPHCGGLLFDPEDIAITSRASFTVHCGVSSEFEAPTEIVHPDGHFLDLQRAGHLYKLEAQIPPAQLVHGAVNVMPVPVTHCIQIQAGDLEQAVIAEARGIPERWHALPSVRFEDVVCAEITTASYLSYFLPRGADAPPNVNLVMGWTKVSPHPLECGLPAYVEAPVTNTGQSWFSTVSGNVKFIIENIHVRSGTTTGAVELSIETSQLGPGMRHILVFAPIYVTTYVNELHRLQVRADFDNQIQETNENDNVWFTEYILSNAQQSDRCFDVPWLTATPTYPYLVEGICLVDLPPRREGDKIIIRYSDSCHIDEFRQGPVEEPSAWQHTLRGCDIRVYTEVDGQDVRVRWSNRGGCEGGLRQYRQTVEVRGERVRQLVIDHDPPTPIPTPTPYPGIVRLRNLRQTHPLRGLGDVTFNWDAVSGAVSYDFRYRLTGATEWIIPAAQPGSDSDLTVTIGAAGSYEWQVRVDGGMDSMNLPIKGPWTAERFTILPDATATPLPVPGDLRQTPPLRGLGNVVFNWDMVSGAVSYDFRYRLTGATEWIIPAAQPGSDSDLTVTIGAAGSYEWQVRADMGAQLGNGPWTASNYFTILPDATATPIPAPGNLRQTPPLRGLGNVVFNWDEVPGAVSYDFSYRLEQGGWLSPGTQPGSNFTITVNIGVVGSYEWRVRADMGTQHGNGPWATGRFTIQLDAPATPLPIPSDLRQTHPLRGLGDVVFRWNAVSGAASYDFRYRLGQGDWVYPSPQPGSNTTITVTIGAAETYEWQVRADMGAQLGKGPWTASTTFTILPNPPATPIPAPSDLRQTPPSRGPGDVVFRWDAVSDADSYDFSYRLEQGGWIYPSPQPGSSTTITVNIGVVGSYEWRVRADMGTQHGNGPWAAGRFTILPDATATPIPAPGDLRQDPPRRGPGNVMFSWDAVSNADSYDFRYRLGQGGWIYPSPQPGSSTTITVNIGVVGIYAWQVRADMGTQHGNGPWATGRFTILPDATATPIPAPGDLRQTHPLRGLGNVVFNWDVVSGAASYDFSYRFGQGSWIYPSPQPGSSTTITVNIREVGSYEWRVRADMGTQHGNGPWTASNFFTILSDAPATPIPAPGDLRQDPPLRGPGDVVFNWDMVSGAVSYDFRYRLGQDGWIYPSSQPGGDNNLTVNIGVVGTYDWQVRADMGTQHGNGPWAAGRFTIQPDATATPIPAPGNLRQNPPLRGLGDVTFNWDMVSGAVSYDFRYRLGQGGWIYPSSQPGRDNNLTVNIGVVGTYDWQVRADMGTQHGNGPWAAGRFTIQPNPTATPSPIPTPSNLQETIQNSGNVMFSWDAVSGATSYSFRYRDQGRIGWISPATQPGGNNNLTVNIGYAGTYEWRVRANIGSRDGPWAESNFMIPEATSEP